MPKVNELTITIEDKPGALGRCFNALAEAGVNIVAFQSFVEEGESLARIIPDKLAEAKTVLGKLHMIFEVTEAAVAYVPNRPGVLGRAAASLGEHRINIDYSYCGTDAASNRAMLVFGVDNVPKAVQALDSLAF